MSDKPPKDDLDWLIRKLQESRDRHPAGGRPHLQLVTNAEDFKPQQRRHPFLRVIKGGLAASGAFAIWRFISSRPLQAALVSFATGAAVAAGLIVGLRFSSPSALEAMVPPVAQSRTPQKAPPAKPTLGARSAPAAPVASHPTSTPPPSPSVRSASSPSGVTTSPGQGVRTNCTVELLKLVCVQVPGG